MPIYRQLAVLSVDDFYKNYSIKIGEKIVEKYSIFKDLYAIWHNIESIDIEQNGDSYLIVVQLRQQ